MLNKKKIYKHGPYAFLISTVNIANDVLKKRVDESINGQFKSFILTEDTKPTVEFYFTETIDEYFQHMHHTNIGLVQYANNSIKFVNGEVAFVYIKKENLHQLFIQISDTGSFKSNIRLLHKGYIDNIEKQISVFYYRIFLIFTQLVNLEYDTTYIHGASISDNNNNAILFPADSGVGKSSVLFGLAKESEYSYIADDLSIIDDGFNTYYSGRAISMKPYHIKYFPFLSEIIEKEMPKLQQIQWKILRDNRLTYGINPQILYSNKIKEQAVIKKVIHLVNTNDKDFTLKNINVASMATASANILMNELFLGYFNLYKALSIPGNDILPSPVQIYEKTIKQYTKLFNNVENHLLWVPYMSNPQNIREFLLDNNILE